MAQQIKHQYGLKWHKTLESLIFTMEIRISIQNIKII